MAEAVAEAATETTQTTPASAPDAAQTSQTGEATGNADSGRASSDAGIPEGQATDRSIADLLAASQAERQSPEQAQVKPAAPATPPTIEDPQMAQWAKDAGLTPNQIASYQKAGVLEDVLVLRQVQQMRQQQAAQAAQPPQQPQAQQPQAPAQPQAQPQAQPTGLELKWEPEDGGQFDKNLVKNIEGLAGHLNSRTDSLRQEVAGAFQDLIAQHLQPLQQMLFSMQMDSHLGGLGKEYAEAFGEGSIFDLDPKSPQYQARQTLAGAVSDLMGLTKARGGNPVINRSLVKRALAGAFPDLIEKLTRQQVVQQTQQAARQRTMPPTQRQSSEHLTQHEQALQATRGVLSKYGLPTD